MNKRVQLVVASYLIKYPSIESYYITSKCFLTQTPDDFSKQFEDYKSIIEVDGFKVVNTNALIISDEDIQKAWELANVPPASEATN